MTTILRFRTPEKQWNLSGFARRINSIVFRLIGPCTFVDRQQNSIVPLSNEFYPQLIEIPSGHMLRSRPFHCKKCDFRCFRPLAARPHAAGCQRAWRCALSQPIVQPQAARHSGSGGRRRFPYSGHPERDPRYGGSRSVAYRDPRCRAPVGLDVNAVGHAQGADPQKLIARRS